MTVQPHDFGGRRLALFASVGLAALALSSPAAAQDADADIGEDAAVQGAIVVTGSRISNPNLEQSSPVNVLSEDEVLYRGASTAEELVGSLPGVSAGLSTSVNNGSGGYSTFNLRGLDSNRNLVLLDGTRIVPSTTTAVTDLNIIPLALVERTEILTGGASSVYGADAISGVLNFVTKRDFEGMELALVSGINEAGDGARYRADLTVGANFDDGRGNAALSVGYQKLGSVLQGDRAVSQDTLFVDGSAVGSGTSVPTRINGDQYDPATGDLVDTYNSFNFAPFNYFQTPLERYNVFGTARYEVTPGIEVYGKGMFTKSVVDLQLAPAGMFGDTYDIPLNNAYLTPGVLSALCTTNADRIADAGFASCTDAAAAGFAVPTTVNRRFVELGNRQNRYVTNQFQIWAGVRGDITDNIGFDVYGSHGESDRASTRLNWGLKSRVQQALFTQDADTCLTDTNGCYPINLFGNGQDIDPRTIAFINQPSLFTTKTTLDIVSGSISGDLGSRGFLAADTPIGFSIGAEYRKYTAGQQSDAATGTQDEVLGTGAPSPSFSGQYNVSEIFGETIIPIVEDLPGIYSLTVEAGARYSHYSNAGNTFTWKAGGSYEPIAGLKLRGIYQKAERAPNIGELFEPVVTGLNNLAEDPCQGSNPVGNAALTAICIAQGAPASSIGFISPNGPSAGQINETSGGNPDLQTEKATTFTAGFVISPQLIPHLTFSADYYNIKITDAITVPTPGDILDPCFGSAPFTNPPGDPSACALIGRNPLNGSLNGGGDTPGLILQLTNQGTIKTSGVDVRFTYDVPTSFGAFIFDIQGNWTKEIFFQASPTSAPTICVGEYGANCDPAQPEFSFDARATLDLGESGSLSLLWHWIDGLKYEDQSSTTVLNEYKSIPAYSTFDLNYRVPAGDHLDFSIGVYNLTDKKPPIVSSYVGTTEYNSGNTYPAIFDVLGRRYLASATIKF